MSTLSKQDIRDLPTSTLREIASAPGLWGHYDVYDVQWAREELQRRSEDES
jgi:hypothetical protein